MFIFDIESKGGSGLPYTLYFYRPRIAMGKAINIKTENLIRLFSNLKVTFFLLTILIWGVFLFKQYGETPLITVDGNSMNPTYFDGEQLKQEIYPKEIYRYDVVVFIAPGIKENTEYIKRVYGLPGETIQIKDNVIYVNDEPIDDPYFNGTMETAGYATNKITLGDDEYFVLGDNRNDSIDSRFGTCWAIPRALIKSKIIN